MGDQRILQGYLSKAKAELECPTCHNSRIRQDECPTCHGELRNEATIDLLRHLVDRAERVW